MIELQQYLLVGEEKRYQITLIGVRNRQLIRLKS